MMTDEELIEKCLKGDQRAQQALFEKFAGKMMSVCMRYAGDLEKAQDVLQDGFVKVFIHLHKFKGEGSFEGWVRRTIVNEALTYIRRNKSMYLEVEIDKAGREPDYQQLNNQLEVEDLQKMIDQLPTGYKTVFNLYAIEGFSHKEIAGKLGISENTSKSQLSRARVYLQKLLLELERCEMDNLMSNEW